MRRAGQALCVRVQREIDAGWLQAKELVIQLNRLYSRSAVRRWVALGVVFGLTLFLMGIGVGP
jgi:hypothetical protein